MANRLENRSRENTRSKGRTFSASPQPQTRSSRHRTGSDVNFRSKVTPGMEGESYPNAPPPPPPPPPPSSSTTDLSDDMKQCQMYCFSRFINGRLGDGSVKSLQFHEDLSDGIVFARLIGLTRDIGDIHPNSHHTNALKTQTNPLKKKENFNTLIEYLRTANLLPPSCVKTSESSKVIHEIVIKENVQILLDFTFHLLLKLQIYRLKNVLQFIPKDDPSFVCLSALMLGESTGRSSGKVRHLNSLSDIQRLLLNWCSDLVKNKGIQVWNFNASIQDGKVLLAMLNALIPELYPFDPIENVPRGTKFSELKALNLSTGLSRLEGFPMHVANCVSFSRDNGADALEERSVVLLLSEFLIKACVVASKRSGAVSTLQRVVRARKGQFITLRKNRNHQLQQQQPQQQPLHNNHHHSNHHQKRHHVKGKREVASNKGEHSFVRNRRIGSDTAGSDDAWLNAANGDATLGQMSTNDVHTQSVFQEQRIGDSVDDSALLAVDGTLAAVTLTHETSLPLESHQHPSLTAAPLKSLPESPDTSHKRSRQKHKWKESSHASSSNHQQEGEGSGGGTRFEAEKQQWLDSLENAFLKADRERSGMLSSSTVYDGLRDSTPGASKNDLVDLINDWKLPDGRVMYMNMITSLKSHTPTTGKPSQVNQHINHHLNNPLDKDYAVHTGEDEGTSVSDEFELGAGVSIGLSDDRKSDGDIAEEPSPGGYSEQLRQHRHRRGLNKSSPPLSPHLQGGGVMEVRQLSSPNISTQPKHEEGVAKNNSRGNRRSGSAGALGSTTEKIPIVSIRPNTINSIGNSGQVPQATTSASSSSPLPPPSFGLTPELMTELEALRSESVNYGLLQEAATNLQTAHEALLEEHKTKLEELENIRLERNKLVQNNKNESIPPQDKLAEAVANNVVIARLEQELSDSKLNEKKLTIELELLMKTHSEQQVLLKNKNNVLDKSNSPTNMSSSEVSLWLKTKIFNDSSEKDHITMVVPSSCIGLDGRALSFLSNASNKENSNPWEFIQFLKNNFNLSPCLALKFAYELDILFPSSSRTNKQVLVPPITSPRRSHSKEIFKSNKDEINKSVVPAVENEGHSVVLKRGGGGELPRPSLPKPSSQEHQTSPIRKQTTSSPTARVLFGGS